MGGGEIARWGSVAGVRPGLDFAEGGARGGVAGRRMGVAIGTGRKRQRGPEMPGWVKWGF